MTGITWSRCVIMPLNTLCWQTFKLFTVFFFFFPLQTNAAAMVYIHIPISFFLAAPDFICETQGLYFWHTDFWLRHGGSNFSPLHFECRVLTTGPLGKYPLHTHTHTHTHTHPYAFILAGGKVSRERTHTAWYPNRQNQVMWYSTTKWVYPRSQSSILGLPWWLRQ